MKLRHILGGIALAAAAFGATSLSAGPGDNMDDWLRSRGEHFGVLSAAAHDQPAQIAAIKAKTAEMVAAYGALGKADAPPVIWRATDKPVVVYDKAVAPRMVLVPAGEFTMGSNAGTQRRVRIAAPFAVSMFPIVYGEYAAFIAASHYQPHGNCVTLEDGQFASRQSRDWRNPGFMQTPRSPATCVSFADATAYAGWLTQLTGHRYRLLSEAEYEYIQRAGTTTRYSWGDDASGACAFANGYDLDGAAYPGAPERIACHDDNSQASIVSSFKPNAFGLLDTSGDVASWTADCWRGNIAATPQDGSPQTTGDCSRRVLRGGSWADTLLGSADRAAAPAARATSFQGFRLIREL